MADHKTVPVSPSALIPLGGKNFSNMRSVQDLRSLQASASGMHGAMDPTSRLKKDTEVSSVVIPARQQMKTAKKFANGVIVQDKRMRRKGTIIQASAGHTKKTKTPVHQLADREGNAWLAKESDLDVLL